jgi:hypothetical protein
MCTADLKGIIAFRRVPFSYEKCTISEYRKNISEISQKISEFFPEMSEIILKNSDVFAKLSEKRQQMLQEVEKASCSAPKYIAQKSDIYHAEVKNTSCCLSCNTSQRG